MITVTDLQVDNHTLIPIYISDTVICIPIQYQKRMVSTIYMFDTQALQKHQVMLRIEREGQPHV